MADRARRAGPGDGPIPARLAPVGQRGPAPLTEVEAYAGTGEDPASHAHRGPTPRSTVMFGPAGRAYTYFIFGVHWCLNIVCGREGEAAAVLVRAGAVVEGVELARERRGGGRDRDLARGPARLVVALGIGPAANDTSMIDGTGPLLLTPPQQPVDPDRIAEGPRSAWPPRTTCRGVSGSTATPRSAPTAATCRARAPDRRSKR